MNNALLYFGGFLVVIFAALFAVPTFVDWNGYRGVFEEEASKVLGRDVRVGGSVNLRLLPAPYVRFEKVRLADVTGQTGEPFLRVDSFTMWLSGPALLRGVLEASRIDLEKPVLSLAFDGQGGGNWSTIELKPGDLPFVPRDVALRSVNVKDGAIVMYDAEAQRIARVETIDGELSADGIKGPFRFKGAATWSGSAHDVRFSTTTPASDGAVRVKAFVKLPATANSYVLDGAIAEFAGKPKFKGTLAAKVAVPGVEAASSDGDGKAALGVPIVDVKSEITADAGGAAFDALTLSLDEAAEPQIITGTAKARWGGGTNIDVALQSKWLDLDRWSGAGADSAKFSRVRKMGLGLMTSVVGEGTSRTKIDIEQIKVGGETAGGLKIDAERSGNVLKLKTLKAGLPGGSRLDVMGELKEAGGAPSFAGRGFIRGTSLGRLKAWAGKSGATIDVKADGPFSVDGKIAFNDKLFELADASGDINGQPLSGSVKLIDGERRTIDVTLESAKLDTREFFAETARSVEAALRQAAGFAPVGGEGAPKPFQGDMKLRLLAAELIGPDETFRDVDVALNFDRGAVHIESARLVSSAGLAVGLEGRIKSVEGTPRGTLGFDLVGITPEALGDIPRLLGLEDIADKERLAVLRDAKVAGLIHVGARGGKAHDISFDGVSRGAHFAGSAEFNEGLSAWRTSPSRITVTFDAPALRMLPVFAGVKSDAPARVGARPATAVMTAAGIIGADFAVRAGLRSDDFVADYDGRGSWPAGKAVLSQGTLDIKAREASDVLAVLGIAPPEGMSGVKADGTVDVIRDDQSYRLATRGFALGLAKFDGSADVAFAREANGAATVKADVSADHVNVIGMVASLTDAPPAAAAVPGVDALEAVGPDRSVWPAGVFNFALLDRLSGTVGVAFKRLDVSGNLATGPGKMVLALSPAGVRVSDLTAAAAGGDLTGSMALEKAPDGVAFTAQLSMDGVELARLGSSARGAGALEATATARAQSPAGLIAVMAGAGKIAVNAATITGPDSNAAAHVADGVVTGKIPNEPERVSEAMREAVGSSRIDLGARELPITIADGSAKLAPVSFDSDRGSVSSATTIDLMSLELTSSWFLSPTIAPLPPPDIALPGWVAPEPKGPLPAAVVVYTGRLDDLGGIAPAVDTGEFQRELAVRQMERNVQELELLRRTDEERGRLEKERRKALEQERAAAAAAAKAERDLARKRKEAEQAAPAQPPVLPESSGLPAPAEGAANAAPTNAPPANATGALPADTGTPGPEQSGAEPKPTTITVEPIPTPGTEADATAAPAPVAPEAATTEIDPATGLPIVKPAPPPRPRPAQRAQRARSANDELMRSLGGGFP